MIIILVILFAALVVYGFFFIKNKIVSQIVGLVSMLLLALSMVALAYHDTNNWGMKEVTTTTTSQIYTAGESSTPYGVMIKNPVGTDAANYMFMYRTSPSAQMTAHFGTKSWPVNDAKTGLQSYMKDNVVEVSKKSSNYSLVSTDKAQSVTKTTRLEFSSKLMEALFSVGGEAGTLVKQTTTVEVPKDTWLVLTMDQSTKLSKEAPQMQAQMKAELAADPAKAMQMQELQKSDPAAYAKLQVTQIKQLLGIK